MSKMSLTLASNVQNWKSCHPVIGKCANQFQTISISDKWKIRYLGGGSLCVYLGKSCLENRQLVLKSRVGTICGQQVFEDVRSSRFFCMFYLVSTSFSVNRIFKVPLVQDLKLKLGIVALCSLLSSVRGMWRHSVAREMASDIPHHCVQLCLVCLLWFPFWFLQLFAFALWTSSI